MHAEKIFGIPDFFFRLYSYSYSFLFFSFTKCFNFNLNLFLWKIISKFSKRKRFSDPITNAKYSYQNFSLHSASVIQKLPLKTRRITATSRYILVKKNSIVIALNTIFA